VDTTIILTPATWQVQTTCSATLGINESTYDSPLLLYPNPAHEFFTLQSETELNNASLQVF